VATAIAHPPAAADAAWERLEDQLGWYDRKSAYNQSRFKQLKAAQMLAGGAVPVVAAFDAPNYVAAILGALVVVIEGFLQLNQYQQNWIAYRSTAEQLKHEKYLYLARADVYADAPSPGVLLAERVEGLVSQEHAKWVATRKQPVAAPQRDP
jgi:hypothetical protein